MAAPIIPVDQTRPVPRVFGGPSAAGSLLGPQGGNLSPEQMQELMDYLVPQETGPIEKPKFDISDLAPKTGALPYDVRPLANLIDSVYGSKSAQAMPNIREQAKADMTPNGAILQAQAQARLSEHQKATEDYYNRTGAQNPLERVKTALGLKKLANDASGGGSGDLKTQLRLMELNQKIEMQGLAQQLGLDKEGRGMAMELMKDFRKEDAIKNFAKVNLAVKNVRNAIFKPSETGVPQYGLIIQYIKALDPQSTVMFNEAKSLGQAQGLYNKLEQYIPALKSGKNIGPDALQDMAETVNEYLRLAKDEVETVRQDYYDSAETLGIKGDQVVSGPMKRLQTKNDVYYFTAIDPETKQPKGYEVDEDEVSDWVRQKRAAGLNPTPVRVRK